jgi:hypothetical protein
MEAVTVLSRAISAGANLSVGVPEFNPGRLGGSAASLPVRGFIMILLVVAPRPLGRMAGANVRRSESVAQCK